MAQLAYSARSSETSGLGVSAELGGHRGLVPNTNNTVTNMWPSGYGRIGSKGRLGYCGNAEEITIRDCTVRHERDVLKRTARSYTSPYIDVLRARIVLHAAQGTVQQGDRRAPGHAAADRQQVAQAVLRTSLGGPRRRAPAGPPERISPPPDVVVAVNALAWEIPHETGLPLSRLSRADIRREAIRRGIVADIGGTTIWRWLHEDAIKPWTLRSWVFPRDPQFAA